MAKKTKTDNKDNIKTNEEIKIGDIITTTKTTTKKAADITTIIIDEDVVMEEEEITKTITTDITEIEKIETTEEITPRITKEIETEDKSQDNKEEMKLTILTTERILILNKVTTVDLRITDKGMKDSKGKVEIRVMRETLNTIISEEAKAKETTEEEEEIVVTIIDLAEITTIDKDRIIKTIVKMIT